MHFGNSGKTQVHDSDDLWRDSLGLCRICFSRRGHEDLSWGQSSSLRPINRQPTRSRATASRCEEEKSIDRWRSALDQVIGATRDGERQQVCVTGCDGQRFAGSRRSRVLADTSRTAVGSWFQSATSPIGISRACRMSAHSSSAKTGSYVVIPRRRRRRGDVSVILNEVRIGMRGDSRRPLPNSGSHLIDMPRGSDKLRSQAFTANDDEPLALFRLIRPLTVAQCAGVGKSQSPQHAAVEVRALGIQIEGCRRTT